MYTLTGRRIEQPILKELMYKCFNSLGYCLVGLFTLEVVEIFQDIGSGTRTVNPHRINNVFSSEILVGYAAFCQMLPLDINLIVYLCDVCCKRGLMVVSFFALRSGQDILERNIL